MARSRFDNPSYYNSLKPNTSSYSYRADLGARPNYSSQRQPATSAYNYGSDRSERPNASYTGSCSSSNTQPSYSYRSDRSTRPSESSYDPQIPQSQSYSSYSRYAPRTSRTSLVNTTNTNAARQASDTHQYCGTHQHSSYGASSESWMKRSQAVPEEPQKAPLELCAISHEEQEGVAGSLEGQQLAVPDPDLIFQESPGNRSTRQEVEQLRSPTSKATMRNLEDLSKKLAVHERTVAEIIAQCAATDRAAGFLKGQLGQQFGLVDKLLSTQVDAVSTAELNSGKQEARSSRKAITLRAQHCLDNIEEAKKSLD